MRLFFGKCKKAKRIIIQQQGVALIYALVVMAVVLALSLALLYGVGQVSMMTMSDRRQESCYLQALTLSEIVAEQLEDPSSGLFKAAKDYMPKDDYGTADVQIKPSLRFQADTASLGGHYGTVMITFQNGMDTMSEPAEWQSKLLTRQYLDVTVEVYDSKGGKEAVTTKYMFSQELDDDDMVYTLYTNVVDGNPQEYTCMYVPDTGGGSDYFMVYDSADNLVLGALYYGTDLVTMEMAEKWAGSQQSGVTQTITVPTMEGGYEDKEISVQMKMTRYRDALSFEGDEDEYKGKNLKFTRAFTK